VYGPSHQRGAVQGMECSRLLGMPGSCGAKTAVREAGQLRLFRLAVERQFRRAFDAGRLESWASDVAVLLTLSVADEDQP
jgi:hypothetical protein